MNRFRAASFALFALLISFVALHALQSAHAQNPKPKPAPILGKTFLEGMALDEENEPLYKLDLLVMKIKNREGDEVWAGQFMGNLGGLYRIELKPGVYDIFVETDNSVNGKIRPLRLNGVMVNGGKINKLDITMHKGAALETIGEPIEPTLPAIIISEKFAEMQKQIDDLKKQVDELKKK